MAIHPPRSSVAVLGGFGFIGSAVCRTLLARGHPVVAFGRQRSLGPKGFTRSARLTIRTGEIEQVDAVVEAIAGCEVVIDLVHVREGLRESEVASARAASRWMARLGETRVGRLIYVSSGGSIYGPSQRLPIAETWPLQPCTPYGRSKLASERCAAHWCAATGVDLTIVRPANVYGPGRDPAMGRGVVRVMVERALRGEALEVWGDGRAIRDYLYIEDMANALAHIVGYAGAVRVFNVGTGRGVSLRQLVSALSRPLDRSLRVEYREPRSRMIHANVLDCCRVRRETAWQPRVSLPEGLERTLEWLAAERGPGRSPSAAQPVGPTKIGEEARSRIVAGMGGSGARPS